MIRFRFLTQILNVWVIVSMLALSFYGVSFSKAEAEVVPRILSYQGRLTDSSGNLLGDSGTSYYFRFSLWNNLVVGGGARVWPAAAPTAITSTVREGVFTVHIGDTASGYPDALNYEFDAEAVYLQVEVSSNGSSYETLSPRQRISSAAFAQVAGGVRGTTQSAIGTTTPSSSAVLTVEATTTSATPLVIRGTTGQTAALFDIRNSVGTSLLSVSATGVLSNLFASTSVLTVTGSAYIGNLTGPLQAVDGLVSATTSIGEVYGGTGQTAYTTGDILYATAANTLSRLPIGSLGQVLKVVGGTVGWAADITGSGGAGAFATTSDSLAVYPSIPTNVLILGGSATSTTGNIFEVIGNSLFRGALTAYNTITAPTFTATSTSATSTLPNLQTTNIRVAGSLYDSTNAPGTGGYVLQSTGGGALWVATSSLGFASAQDLGSYLTLSAWYATTTQDIAEGGSNLYFTNGRVQTYLATVDKGFFFATTSVDEWKNNRNFFSTTSNDYWQTVTNFFSTTSADYYVSVNNFFSTSSAAYFSSLGLAFSTTSATYFGSAGLAFATSSADAWSLARNFFSTTSASYFLSENRGAAFSTSSASYFLAQNQGSAFSSTSVNYFVSSSSTIPKTYTDNTFTGAVSAQGGLTVGSLNGPLQANAGVVSATTSIGVLYGGTGRTLIGANEILIGNASGGFNAVATTSLGLASADSLASYLTLTAWYATTTQDIAEGGSNLYFTNGRVATYIDTYDKGYFFSTTSAANFINLGLAFSTTSSDYWKSVNNFFSTSSAQYFASVNNSFSTTSASYFASLGLAFSTSSVDAWKDARNFFSTTSASYFSSLGLAWATSSADYYESQQTARNADDLTNNSIEDLQDVAVMTENYGDLLYWNGSAWTDIATSSLALSTTNIVEGSNLFYQDTRVQTYLDTIAKSYFFASTSADYWKTQNNFFSTTSADYYTLANNFFSTTSAAYFSSLGLAWATSSADYYTGASSTIAKTYTSNTFTGAQTFTGGVTSNTLSVGSLNGPLQANNGVVSATTTVGVIYGGTGLQLAPTYGQVLLGQANGTYSLVSTSSLGIVASQSGGSAFGQAFELSGGYLSPTSSVTVLFQSGLIAQSSSTIAALSSLYSTSTNATSTNLYATNVVALGATTTNIYVGSTIAGAGLTACSNAADKLLYNATTRQFTCGTDAGAGGGITSIGPAGQLQNGAAQTFATSSDTNFGLTITAAGDVQTFTTSWNGVLSIARGGTGTSTAPGANQILLGNSLGGYDYVATTSLGLASADSLASYLTLTAWYATTTQDIAEGGTNLYYTNERVATYLGTVDKGFFFSTTSASEFAAVGLAYSTTSSDYWKSVNNFFSTSSAQYFLAQNQGNAFSTTSADYWETQQTARTADDLTNNSIEDLQDVAAMTENYGDLLFWNGSAWADIATTSLGLASAQALDSYLTLTAWYATTTQDIAEGGTNLYYTNERVATYLGTVDKGYFFSTTSANNFLTQNQGNAFSTTSADYWRGVNNFFSTSSANYFTSLGLAFSTTSSDAWSVARNFFSTSSASYFSSLGLAWATSSADYFLAQNQGAAFSTTSSIFFVNASTTIPKTYTSNTFTGAQTFTGGLTVGSLNGPLQANNGVVSATTSIGVLYGGTGLTSIGENQLIIGNSVGGFTAVATTSLGLASADSLASYLTLTAWYATTTQDIAEGGSNLYFTNGRVATYIDTVDKGYFFSTTSADVFAAAGRGFSTTSSDYWKSVNNFFSTSSAQYFASVNNFFSTTSASYFSSLGLAWATSSADYYESQQTARTADDLTNNSIEDLQDVAAMTENYGDLLFWNGSAWADIATSSLGISTNLAFDYLFPNNATSSLLTFSGGLMSLASSTIGLGTQAGGLTIAGGATTTGSAYIADRLAIGTTTAAQKFIVNVSNTIGNVSITDLSATAPFIFLNNTHPGAAIGSGIRFQKNSINRFGFGIDYVGNGGQNWWVYDYIANRPRILLDSNGNLGIGTTSPYAKLSVDGETVARNFTATSTTIASIFPYASTTALSATTICLSADCRTSWPSGGSLFGQAFEIAGDGYLAPTSTRGVIVVASSTIGNGTQGGGLTISGGATTTGTTTASGIRIVSGSLRIPVLSCTETLETDAEGNVICGSDATATGQANDFDFATNFAQISAATTSSIWARNGIFASSTSRFDSFVSIAGTTSNLAIANITSALLATNAQGSVIATTSLNSSFLTSIDKGFFFGTTSADAWKLVNNFYSTTSADYYASVNNFFSTTSAAFFSEQGLAFSTTSSDFWKSVNNFFSTTSAAYFSSLGLAWSTTSADYYEGTLTARNADNLGDNSIEDLNDVAAMTENYGDLLYWNGSAWADIATSSLALSTTNIVEGSNLFYQDTRVQTYLDTIAKSYFFATTSADYWKTQSNFFSTTSADYYTLANNFFSTSSASYFASLGLAFSTTSADAWSVARNFFSTSSASYFLSQNQGNAFSTTSADYYLTQNQGSAFSTTSSIFFVNASTTIPKTYTSNTFTGAQTFTGGVTSNTLSVGTLNGPLQANDGVVSATTSIGVLYGGTGLTSIGNNQLIIGNSVGGFTAVATTSLGLASADSLASYLTLTAWYATTTQDIAEGGSNLYFTNGRVATYIDTVDKGYFFSTTSASSFAAAGLAFSTTSSDYWKSVNNFFSTTSAQYFASVNNFFSTSSASYFASLGLAFSTTSSDAWKDARNFFSTTSASYFSSLGLAWATSSADYYAGASTTIAKTYSANVFTNSNTFSAGATSTNFAISNVTNALLSTNASGAVIATTSLSQNLISSIDKGFFFSTTSASNFAAAGLAFSTTSSDYWKSINNFYSTSSANFYTSIGLAWSTTSAQAFLAANQGNAFSTTSASNFAAAGLAFSTTSADAWKDARNFFSTTSASYFSSLGLAWSTTSADFYTGASTTIPKTYSANVFTNSNTFSAGATSTNFAISNVTNALLSTNATGGVIATTSLSQNLIAGIDKGFFFSTTSANTWSAAGLGFSTTSANAWSLTGSGFSTTSAAFFVNASTTIPKTYSNNTFTGANIFQASTTIGSGTATGGLTISGGATTTGNLLVQGSATTSNFALSNVANALLSTNATGGIIATSSLSSNLFSGIDKGFFFSTTSANTWASAGLAFSTTSSDYWKSINNFYSTSSANFYTSIGLAWSTTSAQAFLAANQGNAFSTTSADAWKDARNFFSTTSASYFSSLGLAWATSSADYYTGASTTIAKTYSANVFTNGNTFNGGLTVGSLNGPLQANNGAVSATTSVGVLYGGTGLSSAPSYGQVLLGQANGTYTLVATSSLGITGGGLAFEYLFPNNSTSTLLSFSGGIIAGASTTIGAGGQTTGLTISGGATTTGNAYFAGNVGVRTTSALASLDVRSSNQSVMRVQGTGSTAQLNIYRDDVSAGGVSKGAYITYGTTNDGVLWLAGTDTLAAGSDNFSIASSDDTPRFTIRQSGQVGIGTTSPYAKLSVVGDVVAARFVATTSVASIFPYASTTALSATTLCLSTDCRTSWPTGSGGSEPFPGLATSSMLTFSNGLMSLASTTIGAGGQTTGLTISGGATTTGFLTVQGVGTSTFSGGISAERLNTTATSTFAGLRITSSGLQISNLTSCTEALETDASGNVICGTDATGSGGGSDFTFATHYGALTAATTSPVLFSGNLFASSTVRFGTGGASDMTFLSTGNMGLGTSSPYAKLSVVGEVVARNFTATSSSATSTIAGGLDVGNGAIRYDFSSGITSISNLALGAMSFDSDSGIVSWMDMPVTSGSTAGTVNSYTAQIDGSPLLTLSSVSDGAGSIYGTSTRVGIGTTTPFAQFSINPNGIGAGPAFVIGSSTQTVFQVDATGGFGAFASSTIGAGGQTTGLTISGGATTTGFLAVQGAGTSTFSGGISAQRLNTTATSTFAGLRITSSGLQISTLLSCTEALETDASGNVICGTDATGSAVPNDFTFATHYGALTAATTSPVLFSGNLFASSTVRFGTGGGSDLTFTTAGKLGIGTSTPFAKLSVHAQPNETNTSLFRIASSTASQTRTLFEVDNTGLTTIGDSQGTGDAVFQYAGDANAWSAGFFSSDKSFRIASSTNLSTNVAFAITKGVTTINVGVGTTSPWRSFGINGTVAINGLSAVGGTDQSVCIDPLTFEITTQAGDTCAVSSARYKHDIQTLPIDGLEALRKINPVSFVYNGDSASTTHWGFIAEELASTSPALAAFNLDGSVQTLNHVGITSVLAKAMKDLDINLSTLASTTASSTPASQGFASSFFSNMFTKVAQWLGDTANGLTEIIASRLRAKEEICVDDQCLTKDDVRTLIDMARNGMPAAAAASSPAPTPAPETPEDPEPAEDTEAPTVSVQGNNPATVEVGSEYVDLGATARDNVDQNMPLVTLVDGVEVLSVSIDTSVVGEYVITYRATDDAGNVGEATRNLKVISPAIAAEPVPDAGTEESTPDETVIEE